LNSFQEADRLRIVLDVSAVPERITGAGRYVWNLARNLTSLEGVEPALITRRNDRQRWAVWTRGAEIVAAVPSGRVLRLAYERMRMGGTADRLAADVYHGPHYTLPARLRTPAVVTVHDMSFFDHPEWHERAKVVFFRRAIGDAVARARVIISISDRTAQRLRALLSPSAPVVVIPLGVETNRFRPEPSPRDGALLEELNVARPYLLYAGTVEPRKNIPSLVQAFARIADRHPQLRLVVAGLPGWGGAEATLWETVRREHVEERFVRPGYVSDEALATLLRGAAGVVYPSRYEGFGLPALEALACGTPVVVPRGTVMEDIVGDAALLFDLGDIEGLAEALDACARGDPATMTRRELGLQIAQAHSWDRSAAQHLQAYHLATGRT
jgi:glycosyltransferase involved in cell wall biosynthesis